MEKISIYVSILFVLTTLLTVWLFFKAAHRPKKILTGIILWMSILAIAGMAGLFHQPPRFLFLIVPPILFIIFLFAGRRGRAFIDTLDIGQVTLLHIIRIPVEITLYFLLLAGLVPTLMTFEGNNYDIISGLSAPVIYYAVFIAKKANRKLLLIWNLVCLGLLINVVIIAMLSAQTPFQQLAFDQPNTAVTYFPFVWLPGVIVPIVLFSHLATIRRLLRLRQTQPYTQ